MARIANASSASWEPGGTRETEAIGLVSVIPHAWMMGTPKRSWYSRMRLSGTAEPPQSRRSTDDRSGGGSSCATPCQIVGTAPENVTSSSAMSRARSAGSIRGPGSTSLLPAIAAA